MTIIIIITFNNVPRRITWREIEIPTRNSFSISQQQIVFVLWACVLAETPTYYDYDWISNSDYLHMMQLCVFFSFSPSSKLQYLLGQLLPWNAVLLAAKYLYNLCISPFPWNESQLELLLLFIIAWPYVTVLHLTLAFAWLAIKWWRTVELIPSWHCLTSMKTIASFLSSSYGGLWWACRLITLFMITSITILAYCFE